MDKICLELFSQLYATSPVEETVENTRFLLAKPTYIPYLLSAWAIEGRYVGVPCFKLHGAVELGHRYLDVVNKRRGGVTAVCARNMSFRALYRQYDVDNFGYVKYLGYTIVGYFHYLSQMERNLELWINPNSIEEYVADMHLKYYRESRGLRNEVEALHYEHGRRLIGPGILDLKHFEPEAIAQPDKVLANYYANVSNSLSCLKNCEPIYRIWETLGLDLVQRFPDFARKPGLVWFLANIPTLLESDTSTLSSGCETRLLSKGTQVMELDNRSDGLFGSGPGAVAELLDCLRDCLKFGGLLRFPLAEWLHWTNGGCTFNTYEYPLPERFDQGLDFWRKLNPDWRPRKKPDGDPRELTIDRDVDDNAKYFSRYFGLPLSLDLDSELLSRGPSQLLELLEAGPGTSELSLHLAVLYNGVIFEICKFISTMSWIHFPVSGPASLRNFGPDLVGSSNWLGGGVYKLVNEQAKHTFAELARGQYNTVAALARVAAGQNLHGLSENFLVNGKRSNFDYDGNALGFRTASSIVLIFCRSEFYPTMRIGHRQTMEQLDIRPILIYPDQEVPEYPPFVSYDEELGPEGRFSHYREFYNSHTLGLHLRTQGSIWAILAAIDLVREELAYGAGGLTPGDWAGSILCGFQQCVAGVSDLAEAGGHFATYSYGPNSRLYAIAHLNFLPLFDADYVGFPQGGRSLLSYGPAQWRLFLKFLDRLIARYEQPYILEMARQSLDWVLRVSQRLHNFSKLMHYVHVSEEDVSNFIKAFEAELQDGEAGFDRANFLLSALFAAPLGCFLGLGRVDPLSTDAGAYFSCSKYASEVMDTHVRTSGRRSKFYSESDFSLLLTCYIWPKFLFLNSLSARFGDYEHYHTNLVADLKAIRQFFEDLYKLYFFENSLG